jgi:hypothetical protein
MGTSKNYVFRGGGWGEAPHIALLLFVEKQKGRFLEVPKLFIPDIEVIRQEAEKFVAEFQEANNTIFTVDRQPVKESFIQRIKRWILQFILRITKRKALPDKAFSDIDYKRVISRCTEIAKEDFSIVKPLYEEIQHQCENTISEINQYKREFAKVNMIFSLAVCFGRPRYRVFRYRNSRLTIAKTCSTLHLIFRQMRFRISLLFLILCGRRCSDQSQIKNCPLFRMSLRSSRIFTTFAKIFF